MIFAEDEVEIASTLRHHSDRGFGRMMIFAAPEIALPAECPEHLGIDWRPTGTDNRGDAVIALAPGP